MKCLTLLGRGITLAILVPESQIKNRVPYIGEDAVQLLTTHNLLFQLICSACSLRKDTPAYLRDIIFPGHSQLLWQYSLDTGGAKLWVASVHLDF